MIAVPYPQIGWRSKDTATDDPRVPVTCPWCLGATVLLEWPEPGMPWELIPVVCRRCEGAGEVRIERRTGER